MRLWRKAAGAGWHPLTPNENGLGENVRVVSFEHGTESGVGLLVRPGATVRVNGQPILGGFRVLEHKDEILLGSTRVYFSAESTPVQVAFHLEAGARRPTCPICRGPVNDGDEAVSCPGCDRWFHQCAGDATRRAKTCWTYAPTCRFCEHPTSLSGEGVWHPELEEGDD